MRFLKEKADMDRNLLKRDPSMYYLKIGAMMVGAYLWGRISSR